MMRNFWKEREEDNPEPWTPYRTLNLPVKKEFGVTYAQAYAETIRNHLFKIGHFTPTEPTKIELTFYLRSPLSPPDIDNLVKKVLDYLFSSDSDNRVTTLVARKRKGLPAIELKVSRDEDFLPNSKHKTRKDFVPDEEDSSLIPTL